MRTTLTIDDDLAGLLKRRAKEMDRPFKEIVNAALRRGLAGSTENPSGRRVVVEAHDFGTIRPGVDPDRFNQLVDELEAEEFLRQSRG